MEMSWVDVLVIQLLAKIGVPLHNKGHPVFVATHCIIISEHTQCRGGHEHLNPRARHALLWTGG